jgi:hypothetical protein
MKTLRPLSSVLVALILSAAAILPAAAQLPSLGEQPWLGYYAVFINPRYQFTITADGAVSLIPMGDKREPVGANLAVPIKIAVEELLPDGKTSIKGIQVDSLQSAQPATEKLSKAVITGKVAGAAAFEVTIEQIRGTIFIGGHVTDPGTIKNPLHFAVYAGIPSLYPNTKTTNKKEELAFQKKVSSDHITIKGVDGKSKKVSFDKKVDASSAEISGTGIAAVEMEASVYARKKFQFVASPNSALTLKNELAGPLHSGFTIRWEADKAKDPTNKARFACEVK